MAFQAKLDVGAGAHQLSYLDNNFPGEDKYEWMTVDEFLHTFTAGRSGWAIVLLDAGPPLLPWN